MDMSIQKNLSTISFNKSIYRKKTFSNKLSPKANEVMWGFTGGSCLGVKKIKEDIGIENTAGNCHVNVRKHVEAHGGKAVSGWLLAYNKPLMKKGGWLWAFHSIWENADGLLIDVTNDDHYVNHDRTIFVPDRNRRFDFENGISYNNIIFFTSQNTADIYSEHIGVNLIARKIYWANDDFSILKTREEHDGQYRLLNDRYTRNRELLNEKYGVKIKANGGLDTGNVMGIAVDALMDFSLRTI